MLLRVMFTVALKWGDAGNAFRTASAQSKCSLRVDCYNNCPVIWNLTSPSLFTVLPGRYSCSPHFTDEETEVQWYQITWSKNQPDADPGDYSKQNRKPIYTNGIKQYEVFVTGFIHLAYCFLGSAIYVKCSKQAALWRLKGDWGDC